jgi:hypothetical protein
VLVILGEHGAEAVLERLRSLLDRFPGLIRNIYKYCRYVNDRTELAALLLAILSTGKHVTEEQLFWIAKIAEDFLSDVLSYPDIILKLHDHPSGSDLSRAKLLEIPDSRYGLREMRYARLRTGESNWTAWAAATGCPEETPISRNHILGYAPMAAR